MVAVDLKHMHERFFDVFVFADSLQLFDALTIGKRTKEQRLMIETFATRQSYKRYKTTGVGYNRSADNSAYCSRNIKDNGVLQEVFERGLMKKTLRSRLVVL